MRVAITVSVLCCPLLIVAGCGTADEQPISPLMARLDAAKSLAEGAERDSTFGKLALDAAAEGDVFVVTESLNGIGNKASRDQVTAKTALMLGKAGKGPAASRVANKILDSATRSRVLGKIAKGDYSD